VFTVYLCLPVSTGVYQADQGMGALPVSKKEPEARILLVEDYAPNVMVTGMYLEQFGFEYDVAGTGKEALEMYKKGKYHAILMDIQMHDIDGYRTTEEIRKYERESGLNPIKIIGVTAHALPADRERCLAAGMNDYLSKPFNPEDLRKKLVIS
jgi:CheY-like chemotaxis protein